MIYLTDVKTVVSNYAAAVGVGLLLGAMASLSGAVIAWGLRLFKARL